MDKRIRKHEKCIITQPSCDFVFSSTRNCFIAYGFDESTLEMTILRRLLGDRGIETVEAGGFLTPGQNAFCGKICSKIITAQFCIIMLNGAKGDSGKLIPNANVNMEYGLMLGFNKYVLPFQRKEQDLPFNVRLLDTVKYTDQDFELKATSAIDLAIRETTQDTGIVDSVDEILGVFLLSKKTIISHINNDLKQHIFDIGSPFGLNVLNDFKGQKFTYWANYSTIRAEGIIFRLNALKEILDSRPSPANEPFDPKERFYMSKVENFSKFYSDLRIWVLVANEETKQQVINGINIHNYGYLIEIFTPTDVQDALAEIAR